MRASLLAFAACAALTLLPSSGLAQAPPVATAPHLIDGDLITARAENEWWMAATVWGEARNQGPRGMQAVADVIFNRVGTHGSSIREIVTEDKQFSCWNSRDPNRKLLNKAYLDTLDPSSGSGQAWTQAQQIAKTTLTGTADTTQGASAYHERHIHPKWTRKGKMIRLEQVGDHIFYKTKPYTSARVVAMQQDTSDDPDIGN